MHGQHSVVNSQHQQEQETSCLQTYVEVQPQRSPDISPSDVVCGGA